MLSVRKMQYVVKGTCVSTVFCRYKLDVGKLICDCFHGDPAPKCLADYMKYVYKLEYTQQPDYSKVKGLFQRGLKDMGSKDDHKGLDWITSSRKVQ